MADQCCPMDCEGWNPCRSRRGVVNVGTVQAFCGNDECTLFYWNPAVTLDENLLTSSARLKTRDSLHTADVSEDSAGAAPLGSRGIAAPAKSASLAGCQPCARGSRIIASPYCARRLTALPPHALRRVRGHSDSTAPHPALLPGVNAGVSAPEVF